MMDKETALGTLRLSTDESRTDIIAAYDRLARRYPLQQFSERHARLLEAKTILLSPELAFKNILLEEHIDMKWLNRYSSRDESSQLASADQNTLPLCLEALCRSHLKKGFSLFPIDASMEGEFAQLFDELGPDGLQELIEGFGLT